jgi:hypothetical protein
MPRDKLPQSWPPSADSMITGLIGCKQLFQPDILKNSDEFKSSHRTNEQQVVRNDLNHRLYIAAACTQECFFYHIGTE